ncbi:MULTISPECIES: zinc-dependent alcohol dehydrogenase family protein [Bradyrhizobium]|uniref:zinc-dependent alcohol dehydrogenase family protein n=1 Tax=Bradyrhizobium TaxID=374 RepID=UPI000485A119|nr:MULTISPECIES: NAD(P)-dependent alcohol dehydrogenase [Bradyrhizobium]UFW46490.1 NAD(P)-dependent alcohol dehydrogenase [Bradyrhizobium arachidis]
MKVWQVTGPGREALKLVTIPKPQAGVGEVGIRVKAVSLNYRDRLMIENNGYAGYGLPFTPCSDLVGEVETIGEGVARFAIGDRVINNFTGGWTDGPPPRVKGVIASFGGPLPGTLTEYISLPEDWLVKAPATLTDAQASTLPCTGLTAWTSLVELGRLAPGQTVVVQGTGGFSLFALQLARSVGAEVIVTTTSTEKADRARALGAKHVINRAEDPDWAARVVEVTGGRGADHILEVAGGANLGNSVRALAPSGRISLIGVIDSFDASFPSVPAIHGFATVQAVFVGHRRGLENLVRAIGPNGLIPVIDSEFEFAAFPDALARLEQGPFGKVVVRVT